MKKKFFLPSYQAADIALPLKFGKAHSWLAPLAGYSDLPFRLLCREMGASVCETEMVSAKGLLCKSPGSGEILTNSADDSPLIIQLFGSDPHDMAKVISLLGDAGYMYFDVNMGCAVPKVMRQGAGAALLGNLENCIELARQIISAGRKIGSHCKIGFKLRAGLSENKKILPDLALRLEDLGTSWICLHPRYAKQGFSGNADWGMLEELANKLCIPIVASGDMWTAEDGMRCLAKTGVSSVMYARGALRNPAIFRDHTKLLSRGSAVTVDSSKLGSIIRRHIELIATYRSPEKALFSLKFIVPRYVKDSPNARQIRKRLSGCSTWNEFEEIMDEFFPL